MYDSIKIQIINEYSKLSLDATSAGNIESEFDRKLLRGNLFEYF